MARVALLVGTILAGILLFSAEMVHALDGATAIAVDAHHTCALTTGGGVKCWGDSSRGQLGNGSTDWSFTPVDVTGLSSGVTAVEAGGWSTCALTTGGGVKCWGYNSWGELGDGTTDDSLTPVDVVGLSSGVTAIVLGWGHACALTTGGGVKCWGRNDSGQLGDGSIVDSLTPVDVIGLSSGVTAIEAGGNSTCALTTGGGVKCWGLNGSGQLGDGTFVDSATPVDVVGLSSGVSRVIVSDDSHTCAVTTGGGVKCWGYNNSGQLGDGTTDDSSTPLDVVGLSSGVSKGTAGDFFTCVVTTGGGVKCWGRNDYGQLGDGTTGGSLIPVDVIGLGSGVSAVEAGCDHICAVTTGGEVKCWGRNDYGQLGDGTTNDSSIAVDVAAWTIAGNITEGGIPLSGVTVNGGVLGNQTTDASGHYAFLFVAESTNYTLTPSKAGYTFSPTTASGTVSGNATHDFTGSTFYTLSGTVTEGGNPLAGVTVAGSGALGSQVTDASGNYSFTNVPSGTNFTLTPSKANYTFNPTTASGSLPGDTTHNFTATLNTYTISGTVTVGGNPLSGVTVTGSGALGNEVTDASGNYSFAAVAHGTVYTLTPSMTGYTFSPTDTGSQTLTGAATHNFTATLNTYTISGTVTVGGNPLSGVTVTGSGALGSEVTDASGNYSFAAVAHGTVYTLTPSMTGYTFSPTDTGSQTLTGAATHNFTATLNTYTISGTVTVGGNPLSGVTVTGSGALGSEVTDASGNYSFAAAAHGTVYTLTLSKTGYTFSPTDTGSQTLTGAATHNFTATLNTYTISGTVTVGGNPLSGVTVTGSGALGSEVTDASGNYSFSAAEHGTVYTLTPSMTGYTFSPPNFGGTLVSDTLGNFSGNFSLADSDNDGVIDDQEVLDGTDPDKPDSDDDGLIDGEEKEQNTDPNDADSDKDGVTDGQEVLTGTDPRDRGSVKALRDTTLCTEWNGFLGMSNILEHVNQGTTKLRIESTLHDIFGKEQGAESFGLKPGYQYDLLAHDMAGHEDDYYGLICSTATNGHPGELDGRMVFYKPDTETGGYQFVFAMPLGNGIRGTQYVPYNTYQPSLDPVDALNLPANWIQLTNLEHSKQTGELVFYDREGREIARKSVLLGASGRFDHGAHDIAGRQQVGIVEWIPTKSDARFQLRNVRYYYRAQGDNFDGAFQLEGVVGSGELLSVPLDTAGSSAILELANTLAEAIKVEVAIYPATGGNALHQQTYKLGPHATYHLITDDILNGQEGMATITANKAESVIATAMQYGRTSTLGMQTIYGIQASEAIGTVMRGSYNTFLKQGCRLLMVNPTGSEVVATVSLKRYDGTEVEDGRDFPVPAHGLTNFDLCSEDAENAYGVVTVQPAVPNAIFATVLRIGENEQYRFPTPVRE